MVRFKTKKTRILSLEVVQDAVISLLQKAGIMSPAEIQAEIMDRATSTGSKKKSTSKRKKPAKKK